MENFLDETPYSVHNDTEQKGDDPAMDINSLLPLLLGGDNTNEISRASGASQQDVGSVLTSALPMLLGGKSEKGTCRRCRGFAIL